MTCAVCSPSTLNDTGAIYVRWGRTSCPNSAVLLYRGRAAGAYYGGPGSGSNSLCLTEQPLYFHHNDASQKGAFLYGSQYSTSGYGIRSLNRLNYYAVPCAVCLAPGKSASIVSPGRIDCPSNFEVEYFGYLFASHHSHAKINWICLDKDSERKEYYSSSHSLWSPTEVICGSLKCGTLIDGGYVQYHEVTCAVCTPTTKRRSSIYTRYGRNECPSTSVTVYSGFVAGSAAGKSGGGANVLCMRNSATYMDHNGNNQGGAYLYGFEYETSSSGLKSTAYRAVNNREIPCAVCENVRSESTFTQFGSRDCPESYKLDYSGFVFGAKYSTSSSLGTNNKAEFVCIDFSPQPYENGRGTADDNQGRYFAQQTTCSGLPCPPFTSVREITCAVCSKTSSADSEACAGYRHEGTCVLSCPAGTYAAEDNFCRSCHPLCHPSYGCEGKEANRCHKCLHVRVVYFEVEYCAADCPSGFSRTSEADAEDRCLSFPCKS